MITFTVQHILILRTLIQYKITTTTALQCVLFLASAQTTQREEIGFYDFIKSPNGLSSKVINRILTSFENSNFVKRKSLTVTKEGYEIYYQLSTSLKNNEAYLKRIESIYNRIGHFTEKELLKEVHTQLIYHKCRPGFYIFPKTLTTEIKK
jgi:predicted transcriptional regulator